MLLTSVAASTACPVCAQTTSRIHSVYTRTLADLSWAALPVQFRLTVRRFFCPNPACTRRIFGERLPAVVAPFARRTTRLTQLLQHLVLQVGGQTGARLAQAQGMPVSPRSLLRLSHTAPLPAPCPARIIGIDDWAWRKARNYGTIIVDLERHQPIDLLPDRDKETVAAWLAVHPEVEIVSRDRAGAYAEAVTQGRPEAIQVADRFHLVKNLVEALEKVFLRKRALLKSEANPVPPAQPLDTASTGAVREEPRLIPQKEHTQPSDRAEAASRARHDKYVELYHRIHDLHRKKVDLANIARQVGASRRTVYRYLAMTEPPVRAQLYRPRSHKLDPYKPYILIRWNEGCRSARHIWRELQEQGYPESDTTVSRFVARLRKDSGKPRSFKSVASETIYTAVRESRRPWSALQATRVLVTRPERRLAWQSEYLARLVAADSELKQTQEVVDSFMRMIRQRPGATLEAWILATEASGVPELQNFGRGLRQDFAAVAAGLTLEWSNGQTEAQVGRLKMLKRTMNGRAGFALLKQRVLYRVPDLAIITRKRTARVDHAA